MTPIKFDRVYYNVNRYFILYIRDISTMKHATRKCISFIIKHVKREEI